jgi:hypothetical protein
VGLRIGAISKLTQYNTNNAEQRCCIKGSHLKKKLFSPLAKLIQFSATFGFLPSNKMRAIISDHILGTRVPISPFERK